MLRRLRTTRWLVLHAGLYVVLNAAFLAIWLLERARTRVMGAAGDGEVLVSRTVRDLVAGSDVAFDERGSHALKGIGGEWQLFAIRRQQTREVPP